MENTDTRYVYMPTGDGYHIRIGGKNKETHSEMQTQPTATDDKIRLHRRPLYPPAFKEMIWDTEELKKIENYCFRPLILTYNEPRFLFDFHSAGGLLGHLYIGLVTSCGAGKWFHQWSEIDVSYINGHMEYTIRDPESPELIVHISAITLADSAGLAVKLRVEGLEGKAVLVWGYGGASAYFTNYKFDVPEFTFSPCHCKKDKISWEDNCFALSRVFDTEDTYMNEPFASARYLPDWHAVIKGGGSMQGDEGFGSPDAFAVSPARLLKKTEWVHPGTYVEKRNCVAVQSAIIDEYRQNYHIVVGMGRNIDDAIRHPDKAWAKALSRNNEIAGRITIHTPDLYLDSTMKMAAFATEGIWGGETTLHGAFSWRFGYLGWRSWYGLVCYGWGDRIRKAVQNHIRLGMVKDGHDKGVLGSLLEEEEPSVFFNMNDVFIDQVRHYFEYTNDLDLMKVVFPVIKNIIEWENKRLQPENESLYESCLNILISDSHWYIGGQTTISSAYMLSANNFLADLAERLGEDPTSYKLKAGLIRSAMQRKLWQPAKGVYAEYLDTRGCRLLHPEPSLPTIIHSTEFGAADDLQIYEMLNWADSNIKTNDTGLEGKLYWNSNWSPHYSHWEPFYGDNLNFALTNYLGGCADNAYALLRGVLCSFYKGPTPGGLSSGLSGYNDEFSDSISMWGRTIYEGLFGIRIKRNMGMVELTPQFPDGWPEASICSPHFSYTWKQENGKMSITWNSPVKTVVHLRLPVKAAYINDVIIDEKSSVYKLDPGVGLTWLLVNTPICKGGEINICYAPIEMKIPERRSVIQGEEFTLNLANYSAFDFNDPQGVLKNAIIENGILHGIIGLETGSAMFFLSADISKSCPMWIPVRLNIRHAEIKKAAVWSPPQLPGRNLEYWYLQDLKHIYNASSPVEILERVAEKSEPPGSSSHQVGYLYWKNHLLELCARSKNPPVDTAWRTKTGNDNIAWSMDGIPFKTAKTGPNIGVVTMAGGYPEMLTFDIDTCGKVLYLLISGVTWPIQSHIVNLRFTLYYADGIIDSIDLENPSGISSCWAWLDVFNYDTPANGFENIGGRFGLTGSSEALDDSVSIVESSVIPHSTYSRNMVDTIAQIVPLELRQGIKLNTVSMAAIANDVIFGIMGATVLL